MRLADPQADRIRLSMSEAAPSVRAAFGVFRRRPGEAPALEHFTPCVLPGFEPRMQDYHPGGEAEMRRLREEYACIHPEGVTERVADLAYKHRTHPARCARCALRPGCPGIEEDYLRLFGGSEFQPLAAPPRPYFQAWARTNGMETGEDRTTKAQAKSRGCPQNAGFKIGVNTHADFGSR